MQQGSAVPIGNSYSTTKYTLTEEGRRRRWRRCCSYERLVVFVILLSVLCVVMTGLFLWRIICISGVKTKTPSAKTYSAPRCPLKPIPVPFKTLPPRIAKQLTTLQELIISGVKQGHATAVSANVVYRDKVIWSGGFGVMNKSASNPTVPTANTIYPCASITKIVTALMLFKLYSDKKLSFLSEPVTRFEPNVSVRNPFDQQIITLGDLATQRSGLPREAPCYPPAPGNLCPYDYDAMLQRIKNITLLREPGTEPQYSNLGWSLLGQILAKAFGGGRNYTSWMDVNILRPLGMSDSTFLPTESQRQHIPVGYTSKDAFSQIQDWGWLAPAGGLFSSVHDLAKMEIQLMSGKIFTGWVTEEFFKPAFLLNDGLSMIGIPWEGQELKGLTLQEKTGYIYGYNSYVAMVPGLKLAFNSMCTNCNRKLDVSIQRQFRKIISTFHDVLMNALTREFTLPPDTTPYIGHYKADSSLPIITKMEVHLSKKGDNQSKLTIAVNNVDLFFVNYTRPLHFKVRLNSNILRCKDVFNMGVEGDPVLFDAISPVDGLCDGFTMYNAHPSGHSYFKRIR